MRADDVGNHGLERRERRVCQVLAPRVRIGLAQLFAGMGIKYGHGIYDDTRKGRLYDRQGTLDCAPCIRNVRAKSASDVRLGETRAARISKAFPPRSEEHTSELQSLRH